MVNRNAECGIAPKSILLMDSKSKEDKIFRTLLSLHFTVTR